MRKKFKSASVLFYVLASEYKVKVYTGKKRGARTDADVFITLYGDEGESGAIMLNNKKNNFGLGQFVFKYFLRFFIFPLIFFSNRIDEFTIECPSVGELNKILISHNNKGTTPGWFLDRILIESIHEHRIYEFPCHKWLAIDEEDGQISRYLYPKEGGDLDLIPTGGK